jgi:hypothetical protein
VPRAPKAPGACSAPAEFRLHLFPLFSINVRFFFKSFGGSANQFQTCRGAVVPTRAVSTVGYQGLRDAGWMKRGARSGIGF